GDRIVVCYTLRSAPDKAFFRVIRHGALGPVTELTIAKDWKHNLSSEYMVLYSEADRIWFVNTLEPNRLFELKLVDTQTPERCNVSVQYNVVAGGQPQLAERNDEP